MWKHVLTQFYLAPLITNFLKTVIANENITSEHESMHGHNI